MWYRTSGSSEMMYFTDILLLTICVMLNNVFCRVRECFRLLYKVYPMMEELTYISASPMYKDAGVSPLLMSPVKQEYYWSRHRFPSGLRLPCWHHYISGASDHFYYRNEKIKRIWYIAENDFVHLTYVELLYDSYKWIGRQCFFKV